MIIILI